jgi:hypothetical protein
VTKNNLEKIANTVYRSAGVSANIFASTSNLALTVSLQNDLAMVMPVAQKIANVFTNAVNTMFSNSNIRFKYNILPISYYNEKEFLDNTYKGATTGYSFILPALAMGLNQKDIVNVKDLENDLLGLRERLIPLQTSYTESNKTTGNGAGRPTLPDD